MHFKNKKIFKAFKKLYSCNLKSIKINNMAVNVQRIVNKLRINRINKKIHLIEKWRNDKKYFVLVFIFFKKYGDSFMESDGLLNHSGNQK